jgi:N-methylhydantoinase A/oxoprolinase/acetone carboxylase beta subunit
VTLRRTATMRYVGQTHDVAVELPPGRLDEARRPELEEAYADVYRRLFGRVHHQFVVEILDWRVIATGPRPPLAVPDSAEPARRGGSEPHGMRDVYLWEETAYRSCPVYERALLPPGATVQGPAVIEERESTTLLGAGGKASVDRYRNLVIDVH